jgi:hypothetical protein
MKNFQKFLEEITIKGNPGIPGEGSKEPNDKNYLSDIERRAKERLGINQINDPRPLFGEIMDLASKSKRYTTGNEKALEELAKNVILNNFGDLLDNVDLDIKLVKSGRDVSNFMGKEEEGEDSESPRFKDIVDPELIRKIHKAKLGNVIIQGEAKNTKHILHTDEVKQGIVEIFGNSEGQKIFNIWDKITKIADKLDWIIPINIKADMMEQAPEGMAGAVKVEWVPKKKEDVKEEEDSYDEEGLDKEEDSYDEFTPTVRARAIDFPMLIHETVKGIFELIASISQPSIGDDPKEIEMAKTVKLNVSSFEDEAEDFRTGPEIASDFRDFINKNKKSNEYPNIRAHIFGLMMDPKYMSSAEFLKLFRGILNETPYARKKIDDMIDEIIDIIEKGDLEEVDYDDLEYSDFNSDSDIDDIISDEEIGERELSKIELQKEIDSALDNGDMDRFKKLSQEYSKRFP